MRKASLVLAALLAMTASIANASVSITNVSTSTTGDASASSYNGKYNFSVDAWAGHEGDYLLGSFSGGGLIAYKVTYSGPITDRPSTATISNDATYIVNAGVRIGQGTSGYHDTGDARIDYNTGSSLFATIDRHQSAYAAVIDSDQSILTETLISSGNFSLENGQWVAYVSFTAPTMFVTASASSYAGNRGTAMAQTSFVVQSVTSS